MIKQVLVNFGSQVNILHRETWIRIGRISLAPTLNYLKLVDQRLIEPIGILRNINTQIMGILTQFEFEFIAPVMDMTTYVALFGWPWGKKMKANISLEKDRIKLLSLKFRLQMVTGIQHIQTPISSPATPKMHLQKAQTIQLVNKLTCVETLKEVCTCV